MSAPEKPINSSQKGTSDALWGAKGVSEEMRQDWLSRVREPESGWDEPAFPEQSGEQAGVSDQDGAGDVESRSGDLMSKIRLLGLALLIAAGIAWTAMVLASGFDHDTATRWAWFINLVAVLAAPLVLIAGLAALLLRRPPAPAPTIDLAESHHITTQARAAASLLGDAHAMINSQTREFVTTADTSANAILAAVQAMATKSRLLEQSSATAMATITTLGDRIAAMTDTLPRLEDRLATLGETIGQLGGDLGDRHDALDHQLQATALVAEEARVQLLDAGRLLAEQLNGLRGGARETGEELANLAELSSARLDFTVDRVKSVLEATEQRIEASNQSLIALVEKTQAGLSTASSDTLGRFTEHCTKVDGILDALDSRILGQADKSSQWLADMGGHVARLTGEFNALEQSAIARTETLSSTMMQLSGDTKGLIDALNNGHGGAEQLTKQAEALLVALDSGVRELDESIPSAIGRVEAQLGAMHDRIRAAAPSLEAVEAVATGVVSQLNESDGMATSIVASLTQALDKSKSALAEQKEQIAALANAVDDAGKSMSQLAESVGPQMVEALVRVRESADAAANRARAAISDTIPQAAEQLASASSAAVEQAIAKTVAGELEKITLVTDDAVKAAHRATDELTKRMAMLTDTSEALDRSLAASAERVDTQDRELMAERSARLITSLNERAIDVGKWLDKDISDTDWTGYLKGDQGLFARRTTRLINNADAKHVQSLYHEDAEFREHASRYVHDFEMLLRSVMATKDGSTLALTMVSSDIGKLYVALAQAIERLKTN